MFFSLNDSRVIFSFLSFLGDEVIKHIKFNAYRSPLNAEGENESANNKRIFITFCN